MDNQQLYQDQNFTITREMFISGNTRFALRHLCSIKLERAFRQFPYTLCILGIILMGVALYFQFKFNSLVVALGSLLVISSILLVIFRKPIHKLYLAFSSGEREVIENTDYVYLEGLAHAFSRSISRPVAHTNVSVLDDRKLSMKQ
ncbi:DUF6232 family protein [Cohnella sp.]|uniref:DUF6232 family protein n=1 Tax=Cohnella sp. TaxID=1883426 RepID=UPI0035613AFD